MAEAVFINTKIDVDYKDAFTKIGKIEHRLDDLERQREIRININREKLLSDLAQVNEDIETQQIIQKNLELERDPGVRARLAEQTASELDKLTEKRQKILGQLAAEENRIENINYRIGEQNDLLDKEIRREIDINETPAIDAVNALEKRIEKLTRARDLEININKERLMSELAEIEDDIQTQLIIRGNLQFETNPEVKSRLLTQTQTELANLQAKRMQILGQVEREDATIADINRNLAEQIELLRQATQEREQAEQTEEENTAAVDQTARAFARVEQAIKESSGFLESFSRRITGLLKRVFIFSLIMQGLRRIRSWFSQVINANSEATYALRMLRGALLTLIQPLVQYVIPIIVKLIRILTALALRIASFIAGIFGKTLKQSAMDAQSLYQSMQKTSKVSAGAAKNTKNTAKAAKDTADAMEDANESLAGFDKLNVIESDTGVTPDTEIEPDIDLEDPIDDAIDDLGEIDMSPIFDFEDFGLDEELNDILNIVLAILGALAAFSLLKKLTKLTGSLKTAIGIMMALAGAALFVYEYIDAWVNGISWKNLLGMLGGIILLVGGLALAFGPVGAAIGMIVAGVALLVLGVKDMIANGFSYENFAAVAAGLLLIGGAIALLTGSWIPLLIAAIVALVVFIVGKWDEIKTFLVNVWNAIAEFFVNLWEDVKVRFGIVVNAIKEWFSGLGESITEVWETVVGFLIAQWDIIKARFRQAIAVVQVMFSGLWNNVKNAAMNVWNAILNAGRNAINGIIRILNGLINGLNAILWPIRKVIVAIGSVLGSRITMDDVRIPNIPALAQGTVVPPNREFLARLGDNKTEPEIVSPLSTMQQAFTDTLASSGLVEAIERDTAVQSELLETLITAIRNKQLVITPSAALGRVVTKSSALYKGVTG